MKIYRYILTALSAALLAFASSAQSPALQQADSSSRVISAGKAFLRPLQQRDSVLIADQLVYGFVLEGVEEGTRIALPDFSKEFTPGVEVISPWKIDTLKTVRKRRGTAPVKYNIEGGILVTSFDEGVYDLAPTALLKVSPDGASDTLVFEPERLEVWTMPVDTATFVPHDIKAQIGYPLTFKELIPYILGVMLLAILIIAICYLVRFYRRRRDPEHARREPAHIIALRKLDQYRGDKMWEASKQKAFYSGITDVLREYISARYEFGAMEMTTAEIFSRMKSTDAPAELLAQVQELFERADFVKFAKFVASEQDNASALPLAVRFVTETYQAEIEAESKEETEK